MIKLELNGLSPAAFPDPERSGGERSETERSGGSGNAGTFSWARPNPEVVAKAKLRTFTAGYKERILAAADGARQTGQIGALLRREGLYSSLLATWRKERAAGITEAMSPHKRGPKSKQSPLASENLFNAVLGHYLNLGSEKSAIRRRSPTPSGVTRKCLPDAPLAAKCCAMAVLACVTRR